MEKKENEGNIQHNCNNCKQLCANVRLDAPMIHKIALAVADELERRGAMPPAHELRSY